ncbi:polysaccharide deacetylase, partial [Candidatus Magnetomorum sp. HK-1]
LTTIKFASNEPIFFSPWIEKMIGYSNNPENYCCSKYSKFIQPFNEVQKITQELTNRYLSLADITLPQIIPKPKMPSKLKLVQGEFESDESFENRVLSEIKKRDETINKLQVDYRHSVEKRNKLLNDMKRIQPQRKKKMKEQKYLFLKDAVYCVMGGFKLLNPYFEKKTGLLYLDISAINSEYTERIAIKPSNPELTETLYKKLQKINLTVLFSLTNDSIILSKVELKFKINIFFAHVISEKKHTYTS